MSIGDITSDVLGLDNKKSAFIENTVAYKQAEKIQGKIDSGKRVSNYSVGKLASSLSQSQMSSAIQSRLGEGSREVADTISDAIHGYEVSNRSLRAAIENDGALAVINEALGTSFTKDSSLTDVRKAFNGQLYSKIKIKAEGTSTIKAFEGMSESVISDKVRRGLAANVSDKGELNSLTDIIVDAAMGRSISKSDAKKIAGNKNAINAVNKSFGIQIKNGATAAEVKAAIQSVQATARKATPSNASQTTHSGSETKIPSHSKATFTAVESAGGGFDVVAEADGERMVMMHYETQRQAQAAALCQEAELNWGSYLPQKAVQAGAAALLASLYIYIPFAPMVSLGVIGFGSALLLPLCKKAVEIPAYVVYNRANKGGM